MALALEKHSPLKRFKREQAVFVAGAELCVRHQGFAKVLLQRVLLISSSLLRKAQRIHVSQNNLLHHIEWFSDWGKSPTIVDVYIESHPWP